MAEEKQYPISEVFTSPQGEGQYTGTLMTFVRFAGCSVGKKLPKEKYQESGRTVADFGKLLDPLPIWQEECTTYDGRKFLCDTDFRVKEKLSAEEILIKVPDGVEHICFTGGEPMNQDLAAIMLFIDDYSDKDYQFHIETSGTVPIKKLDKVWTTPIDTWVTCSPKLGVLPEYDAADEIKLLVDNGFDIAKVPDWILEHPLVWVQPINSNFEVERKNLNLCIKLLHGYPNFKLSTQMHKVWKVR